MRVFMVLLVSSLALGAAPALAATTGSAGPCSAGNVVSTASYRLALLLGPRQEMYLASEVQKRHIKTGQIMVGGDMAMVDSKPGTRIYNLEVHICTKTGAVVTKLNPVITVVMAGMAMRVATAEMVGIGKPISDYHYGNDVALKPGGKITVKVSVKGQLAVFHATVPRS